MGKLTPNLRLKALRKEIEISQEKLAARSGVSYPYLLSVEIGQRALSLPLAETISCATGIGPMWLLGREGKTSQPLTPTGTPYTHEYYLSAFGGHDHSSEDVDPQDESLIRNHRDELSALMRAGSRKRRLPVATYFFRKMLTDTVKNLGLRRLYETELKSLRSRREDVSPVTTRRRISFDD